MKTSKSRLAGWILSGLLAAFLIGPSAIGKFVEWEGKAEMFDKMGLTVELVKKIGVVEIVIALLFLVPQTAFVAAILLTGYLGGAVLTHLRIGEPIFMPIIIGILVWVALGLRVPEIFKLAFGMRTQPKPVE